LQSRLASYALVLLLFFLGYYPAFYLTWSHDPGFGARAALAHMTHWSAIALGLVYVVFCVLFRARTWSVAALVTLDVALHGAIGVVYAPNIFNRPSAGVAFFEGLLATMSVLAIRALIVPSSARRTALAGFLMTISPTVMVIRHPEHFSGTALAFSTLLSIWITWAMISVVFSTVASTVLYGLRRQVQEAQRFGQYTLLEKLGVGGMGVVYLARHAMLRRPTAIKLLNATSQTTSLARFEQEVQLMADLKHPNAVTIHDYGRTDDGVFYYAMEYLDGVDLELLVDVDGPQPAARVVHLLRQACGALAEAHGRGLIHRDIKPANVFLCRDRGDADVVKVLDFGVVKDLNQASDASVTADHSVVGTPLYMSPESASASPALDARSDLYSLGAVGYFLLAGQPVFGGRSVIEIAARHLYQAPVPPSDHLAEPVPADLERIILSCLQKAPDDRPRTAGELAAALSACASAGAWTGDSARAWWATHGPRIAERRAARAAADAGRWSTAHNQTVAVARGTPVTRQAS
jgi:hypothetical protein